MSMGKARGVEDEKGHHMIQRAIVGISVCLPAVVHSDCSLRDLFLLI